MTLIEVMIVVAIIAVAASGLSYSLGAVTRANLKAGTGKVAAAVRYAYNRAITHGTTVRIVFDLPGESLSIQEAHGKVTMSRADDDRRMNDEGGASESGVDPWGSAATRISEALKPSFGASPFGSITNADGDTLKRYDEIKLGTRIQVVRLIVPHEPAPKENGRGSIHFFPSGYTEHAIVQLSDGREGVFSVEVHPLTGRCTIHKGEYEPRELIDDPEQPDFSEVDG